MGRDWGDLEGVGEVKWFGVEVVVVVAVEVVVVVIAPSSSSASRSRDINNGVDEDEWKRRAVRVDVWAFFCRDAQSVTILTISTCVLIWVTPLVLKS